MKLLLPLVLRRAPGFLLALALSVLTLAAGAGLLGVSGWFLTGAALAGAAGGFELFAPSAAVRGLSFLRIGARYGERMTGHAVTLAMLSELRSTLFARLIPLVPMKGVAGRTGDFVARLTADIEALDMVMLQAVLPLLTACTAAAGLALMLWLTLPEAVPVGVAGFALTALAVPLALVLGGRRIGAATVAASSDLRVAALDAVDGHADLVALGATEAGIARFAEAAAGLRAARLAEARRVALGPALAQLGAGLTMAATLWLGLGALAEGRISGPVLTGVLLAILGLFEVTGPILRGAGRIGSALAASRRVSDIVATVPSIRDPLVPARLPGEGALVIDRVSYGYGIDRPVLADISLEAQPGERIAILGASGSGKSTLLGLIMRLDDVGAGAIRFGGIDIRDAALADLHSHIALLTQDAPVFIGTVRDNLRIGSPFADDATLYTALGNARLAEFVRSLPEGLDTWLGESGATLSAGQARRLCLARTLLSPARLILLDEPTAGLDGETEAEFLGDLLTATEGRTLVVATHAALPRAAVDRIFKFDDGRLVEASR
ncbi:thiol reductant ABC exporter subunit CydC [Mesorhizobium sp. BR1-1-16]|uniref:thiol reductant ABC exporter subunit CydC n=1 Tax=Mesorhizobium sp. BR1-1-16 TaxID=2876653 RepID=UPI001CC8F895|nr:thiol reductant ABC exporter subunit CydC [Mesorhizobium sp. BR1-1-16]MBZ9935308.1 thiol reductant ABC exporter subunit CydC [Mesorhizobium sp. BR1-1-16]